MNCISTLALDLILSLQPLCPAEEAWVQTVGSVAAQLACTFVVMLRCRQSIRIPSLHPSSFRHVKSI